MTRYPSPGHLASWAGTTPGQNESAGRIKSSKTRPGNPYLQGALGTAAMNCAQNPNSYLGARYRRIAFTARATESQRGDPTQNAHHDLAHGPGRHVLRRPRSRLLHPTTPRTRQKPCHPPARSHGLPRHPRTRRITQTRGVTKVNLRVRGMINDHEKLAFRCRN